MAWVKVPPENHPIFHAALPDNPRLETVKMFGGVAAKVNDKVMLPESIMSDPAELRGWIARAFEAARARPAKARKAVKNVPTKKTARRGT